MLESAKLMHRINQGACSKTLINLYNKQTEWYSFRISRIRIESHNSSRYNSSFLCKPVMEWSKLPTELRLIEKTKTFTKRLKLQYLNKY